jgi:hypothetical protein
VDYGQRAGQLDAAEGDRDDGGDLDDEQPPIGTHGLVEHGHPVAGADQGVTQGQWGLNRDKGARLQRVLEEEQRADAGHSGSVELP